MEKIMKDPNNITKSGDYRLIESWLGDGLLLRYKSFQGRKFFMPCIKNNKCLQILKRHSEIKNFCESCTFLKKFFLSNEPKKVFRVKLNLQISSNSSLPQIVEHPE